MLIKSVMINLSEIIKNIIIKNLLKKFSIKNENYFHAHDEMC